MIPELKAAYDQLEVAVKQTEHAGRDAVLWDVQELWDDKKISDDELATFAHAAEKVWPKKKDAFLGVLLGKVEKNAKLNPMIAKTKNAKSVRLRMTNPNSGVKEVTITKSVRGEDSARPWQVTYFDDRGPSGHRNEPTIAAGLEDTWRHFGQFEIADMNESLARGLDRSVMSKQVFFGGCFTRNPYVIEREVADRPRTKLEALAAGLDCLAEAITQTDAAADFVSDEIRHLIKDKGYTQNRAKGAAVSVARKKGFKMAPPLKKSSKKA